MPARPVPGSKYREQRHDGLRAVRRPVGVCSLRSLDPAAAFDLATVCERWRDRDRAEAIYQRVVASGHEDAAPRRVQLALVYGRRGARRPQPSARTVPARDRL
jgi:hypothetical protein